MRIDNPINPSHYVTLPIGDVFNNLTKRELFAAMAMQGFLSNSYLMQSIVRMHSEGKVKDQSFSIAEQATEIADALINALNAEQ